MATIVTRSGKGSPLTNTEVDSNFTNLNTDKLELSGGTLTGNVNFGDNDKAIFGAGSGLQIYHDGATSYISDQGTGNLKILAQNFIVSNPANTETMIAATPNGNVSLYYDSAVKLATTATGIDVTGTVTSDGLTVVGGTSGLDQISLSSNVTNNTTKYAGIVMTNYGNTTTALLGGKAENGTTSVYYGSSGSDHRGAQNHVFYTNASATATSGNTERLRITSTGINVIGTVTSDGLTVESNNNLDILDADNHVSGRLRNVSGSNNALTIEADPANSASGTFMSFKIDASERMRIDSVGNVGIGTSSTSGKLTVDGVILSQNAAQGSGNLGIQGYGATSYINHSGTGPLIFRMGGSYTERMRIDSSGNLLVGKTSPTIATTGVELRPNGQLFATQSGNYPLLLNRTVSDGDIISLRKDGSAVGSIGSVSGALYIGSPNGSDAFAKFNNNSITPSTSAGAARDNAIDLGASSARFKDLYLSGSIANPSGNLTLDVAGEITLDADSGGAINLHDGGTFYGLLQNVSSDFVIRSVINDKNMVFNGTDNNSTITALTLDMSDAGTATFNHDIKLPDNGKAIFGAGSDLQIYHTGSASVIRDQGNGSLFIDGSSEIFLRGQSGFTNMIKAIDTGAVELYHNNSEKLATTSTGIDVTGGGTFTSTLNVNKASGYGNIEVGGPSGGHIDLKAPFSDDYDARIIYNAGTNLVLTTLASDEPIILNQGGTARLSTTSTGINVIGTVVAEQLDITESANARLYSSDNIGEVGAGNFAFQAVNSAGNALKPLGFRGEELRLATSKESLRIANNGDISFYEDTGTTAKFFWDASAESLGIGTSSPTDALHIVSAVSSDYRGNLFLDDSTTGFAAGVGGQITFGAEYRSNGEHTEWAAIQGAKANSTDANYAGTLEFKTRENGGALQTKMVLDDSGNVGIGTSSPVDTLDIVVGTNARAIFSDAISSTGTGNLTIQVSNSADSALKPFGIRAEDIRLVTGSTERMRIDSSGNVGVGVSTIQSSVSGKTLETSGCLVVGGNLAAHQTNRGVFEYQGNVFQMRAYGASAGQGQITFRTGGGGGSADSEAMRIDASGQVVIGATLQGSQNAVTIGQTGFVQARRASGAAGFFDRLTNDGAIIQLRKGGVDVGSIGNSGANIYLANSATGLGVSNSSNMLYPINGDSGATRDNAIDLGYSSGRFKNVHAVTYYGNGSNLTGVGSTTYGAVGTYVWGYSATTGYVEGSTKAGSSIFPAGFIDTARTSANAGYQHGNPSYMTRGGTALSGTWRAMGRSNSDSSYQRPRPTLWVRVS